MPIKIPDGQNIIVSFRNLPGEYKMPSMEMATDHYNIGFIVSGDRRTITPTQSYTYRAGDVSMVPPYVYHRTLSESDKPYQGYLIKFTPEFIRPFWEQVGRQIFDDLYEEKTCHFSKASSDRIRQMFEEILQEYEKNAPYREFILQGMVFRLFTTIWEERQAREGHYFKSPLSEPILNAIYLIEKDYAKGLTLENIAAQVGFSTAHFSRVFAAQLGMSFTDYLSNVRIQHVKEQLIRTDKSITDIALGCGFCHGDYLATQFKRKVGMTPTAFRKSGGDGGVKCTT